MDRLHDKSDFMLVDEHRDKYLMNIHLSTLEMTDE